MRILVDVDGVICNFCQVYLHELAMFSGRYHKESDVTDWHFDKCVSSEAEDRAVWRWLQVEDAVRTIPEYPGATDFLASLRARGQVVAVTTPANTPRWCYERTQWLLDRGFKSEEIIFAKDKSLVRGDVLIDDHPENVNAFAGAGGVGILLDRPWNRSAATGGLGQKVFRVADYADVLYLVDKLAEYR